MLEKVPIISQIMSGYKYLRGDITGARIIQEKFAQTFLHLVDINHIVTFCNRWYCSEPKAKTTNERWMAELKDSTLITAVTIPGTHDSACRTGGEVAKCQTWDIHEQLKAGIRFFDFRCRNIKDRFYIYHNLVDCGVSLEGVLRIIEEFLVKNPSEFVVMRIDDERYHDYATKSFNDLYLEYAEEHSEFLMQTLSRRITVKEARGKYLVIKNFPGKGTGYEWDWKSQSLQDRYQPAGVIEKWRHIEQHFEKTEPNPTKFYINFLTACSPKRREFPRFYAYECNKRAYEYLGKKSAKHQYKGIIVMDFPGEGLVKRCIDHNDKVKSMLRSAFENSLMPIFVLFSVGGLWQTYSPISLFN